MREQIDSVIKEEIQNLEIIDNNIQEQKISYLFLFDSIMRRNIPGYTYDPKTKRFFKTPAQHAPESNITAIIERSQPKIDQSDLEKKIKHCVSAIRDLELYGTIKNVMSNKFTSCDSILASKFTQNQLKFNRNVYLKNLPAIERRVLIKPYCSQLVASPENDTLFATYIDNKSICIAQLDVRQLLKQSISSYNLTLRNQVFVFAVSEYKAEQILPVLYDGKI